VDALDADRRDDANSRANKTKRLLDADVSRSSIYAGQRRAAFSGNRLPRVVVRPRGTAAEAQGRTAGCRTVDRTVTCDGRD